MEHVLGIDVGTTAIKAGLLRRDGLLEPVASARYALHAAGSGRFEQSPDELLDALASAVRQAVAGREVRGIGLSTQAAALLVLDRNGAPRRPIISWMDHRAKAESEALLDRFGAEFFHRRTALDGPGIAAPILLWLKKNEPATLNDGARVSFVEDWLARWLTGHGASDPTNASITGMLNLDTLTWDADMLAHVGIDPASFPPMRRAGEVIGPLLPQIADRLGIAATGAPVAVAAHDQHAAAVGAGLAESGTAMLSTGTAWVIFALSDAIDRVRCQGLFLAPYAGGGPWGALGAMSAGNAYFDRILDALGVEGYEAAESESRAVGPGAGNLLFLPCLAGKREAAWIGFRLDHSCGHMLRSVMEGLAMEASFLLRDMEAATRPVRELAMLGGSAKNRLWVEIVSSVFGRPVTLPGTRDAAAVGAAVLGGVAAGWWKSAREGRAQVNLPVERVEPDAVPYREVIRRYSDVRARFPAGA